MSDISTTIDVFLAIYGLYLAACGVAALTTGRVYGHGKEIYVKYTAQSIRAAAPILGVANIVIGLAMFVPQVGAWISALSFLKSCDWYILIGGAAVGVVLVVMGYRKLVEK